MLVTETAKRASVVVMEFIAYFLEGWERIFFMN